jgi:hypothetical protein
VSKSAVVALLNFTFIGLGTLLFGKRRAFGLLMFVGGSLVRFEELRIAPLVTGAVTIHWAIATSGLALLGLGMALYGHRETQEVALPPGEVAQAAAAIR